MVVLMIVQYATAGHNEARESRERYDTMGINPNDVRRRNQRYNIMINNINIPIFNRMGECSVFFARAGARRSILHPTIYFATTREHLLPVIIFRCMKLLFARMNDRSFEKQKSVMTLDSSV